VRSTAHAGVIPTGSSRPYNPATAIKFSHAEFRSVLPCLQFIEAIEAPPCSRQSAVRNLPEPR
jgi:hypothetical protein